MCENLVQIVTMVHIVNSALLRCSMDRGERTGPIPTMSVTVLKLLAAPFERKRLRDAPALLLSFEECVSMDSHAEATSTLDVVGAGFKALVTDVSLAPGKHTGWDVARHARDITNAA